jgi:phage terminase large subunit
MGRKKSIDLFANPEDKIDVDIPATRVFLENLASDKKINVNIGGGGSSKSHSIIQLLLYKLLTEDRKKILVVRKTMPSMRTSVILPFHEIMDEFKVTNRIREDKVGMNLFYNNSFIHFNGLDDPEKIKSSNWNYMWFEEATEIALQDFMTVKLYLRAKPTDGKMNQIYLSFNPIDEFHWIKEKLIEAEGFKNDVKVIHSTYKDNPFLPEDSVKQYKELINQDINFYRVYALGEWGRLENLIYRNWTTEDMMPRGKDYTTLYGLDFGFNDPSVLVKCMVKDQEIHVEELIYQRGLTNAQLMEQMDRVILREDRLRPIYCDNAEPQRIKEMRLAGFNVREAQKNVYDGITLLKRFNIYVQKGSLNTIKEFQSYSWKTDKNARVLDEPIEFMDHSMAAIRYPIYSHFRGMGVYKIRWI